MEGIGGDPGLDGCTAPAVDDDTLWHFGGLLHALAQEIADGREEPRILFVQGLPIDGGGSDIVLGTVYGGLVLDTEQTDIIVLIGIDLLCILRIDALDGDVDVRLSGEQPHVADHDVGEHMVADGERIGTTGLHLRQIDAPAAVEACGGGILFVVEADGYQFSTVGLAPDGDQFASLENHA